MAYKKLSDFVIVKEYCDIDECTGHDCYCDSFTCKHWIREYVPLYIQQLIENGKLSYNDIQPRIIIGHTMKQEFEVINNYIEERHGDWIVKTHIPVIIADYEKIKEADEKPIDYKALKEFKEKVKEVERNTCLQKDTCQLDTDYNLIATKLRYSITNAINKKYKNMTDNEDDVSALMRLMGMRICLIKNGFLKAEDFEDWGE